MLVEVEACLAKGPPQAGLTSQAVSEVAQAVDLCLSGPDECGSGQTSPRPSLLEPEQTGGSPPPVQVDFPSIQEGADGGGPAIPAAVGTAPDATAMTSTKDFIAAFKKPLTMPVLSSPPRLRLTRVARTRAGELDDSELIPKRSARLAAKSRHREQKLEAQAWKVMMKRLGLEEVETELPDKTSFEEFQTAFALPLSASTREAMQVLFPGKNQQT
ncbi:unnamed protein product [Miscanthus lutarioriparius]|uniref:Uncharacterized protein n=1 Tax=Miscanthus lutarioriparius TaxID=422564 RepID=A0A811RS27_9POAL|nr:unnamed protein product [Miscanthus lutarioriparius]